MHRPRDHVLLAADRSQLVRNVLRRFKDKDELLYAARGRAGELGNEHAIFVSRGTSADVARLHLQIIQIPGVILLMTEA